MSNFISVAMVDKSNQMTAVYSFECKPCAFKTKYFHNFQTHNQTQKHVDALVRTTDGGQTITCPKCSEYSTSDRSNFRRHVARCMQPMNKMLPHKFTCTKCEATFTSRSGLYKHSKKICTHTAETALAPAPQPSAPQPSAPEHDQPTLVRISDTRSVTISLPDLQTIIAETVSAVVKQQPPSIIINNHINQANFNLNVFLNEKCKRAMNIMDFARGVQLQLKDIEHIGNVGYVEGMGDVISTALQELDITERPLHCTDTKREIIHVKHEDKWCKEEPGCPILLQAVKLIGARNLDLTDEWLEAHPSAKNGDSADARWYDKIQLQVTGGPRACDSNVYMKRNRKILKRICTSAKLNRAEAKLCL